MENPQDALVVWTFSAILHNGTWKKAAEYARKNVKAHAQFVPEIRSSSDTISDELILEETSHLASLVKSSVNAFTSIDALQQSLGRYQGPLSSGVVSASTCPVCAETLFSTKYASFVILHMGAGVYSILHSVP